MVNEKKQGGSLRILRYLLMTLFALLMITGLRGNAWAAAPSVVKGNTGSVMQVLVEYTDESGVSHNVQTGSCFLINSRTAATCSHVLDVADQDIKDIAQNYNTTAAQVEDNISIYVLDGDERISASISVDDPSLDFAALRLGRKIKDKPALKLRSSIELQHGEACYAAGYPGTDADTDGVVKSVSLTEGTVERIVYFSDNVNYTYVENSAAILPGDSGGALFDRYGSVIGVIKAMSTQNNGEKKYFAVSINDVEDVLNANNIKYSRESRAREYIGNVEYQITSYKSRTAQAVGSYMYLSKATVKNTVKINGRTYKVTAISKNAFNNRRYLKTLTIGKNVQTIGAKAFYNCKSLKKINIKSAKLDYLGKKVIKKISSKAVIYVPNGKLKAYKKLFTTASGYKKTMKIKVNKK